MTRGFHANFLEELRGVNPKLVVLLEIGTGATPATLYYTSKRVTHTWQSDATTTSTYTARAWDMGTITVEGGETPAVKIVFPDVDSYWDTWLLTSDFRHQKIIRRIYDDGNGIYQYSTSDTLRITGHKRDGYEFTLTAEPLLGILNRINLPARIMTRDDFPGMPREGVVR